MRCALSLRIKKWRIENLAKLCFDFGSGGGTIEEPEEEGAELSSP